MTYQQVQQLKQPKRGFSVREAAAYCGVSKDLLDKLRSQGTVNGITGPYFVKIGNKVVYFMESLDQWMEGFIGGHSLAQLSQLRLEEEHRGQE